MAFHTILDSGQQIKPYNRNRKIQTMDDGLAFYLSELTAVDPMLYEVKHAHITYQDLLPIQMYPEYADTFTYFSYDGQMIGRFVGSNAKDLPYADFNRHMSTEPMFYGSLSYRFSLDELRKTQQLGIPIDTTQQSICIRGFNEHAQQVAYFGDSDRGLNGLLNNPNVTLLQSQSDFTNDAAQARIFCQNVMRSVWVNSVEVHVPNMLLVPPSIFSLMSDTPSIVVANGAAYQSELAFLQQNNIYTQLTGLPLTIKPLIQLEDASAAGKQRVLAYELNDQNMTMGMAISQRFLPPQAMDLFINVPGEYKFGGCAIRYMGCIAYGDNS